MQEEDLFGPFIKIHGSRERTSVGPLGGGVLFLHLLHPSMWLSQNPNQVVLHHAAINIVHLPYR